MPKKPTVKAHRGFIHIPRRGRGPRRPQPYPPELIRDPRLKPPRGPRRPPLQEIRPPNISQYNAELRFLRDIAKQRGKTIPRFPTGTPSPTIRRDPQKMRAFRLRQLQNQINKTKRFLNFTPRKTQQQINDARKALSQNLSPKEKLIAAMGVRRQTAAPAQQAVKNPNRRRPMTADQRQRMIRSQNTRVAKGGTVRKKK